MTLSDFLPERYWTSLIRDIHNGQVVPVVGPELVAVIDPNTGGKLPLHRYLAPLLAKNLGANTSTSPGTINAVCCAHLLAGGRRRDIYDELRGLLEAMKPDPCEPLLQLARITDFRLFISSSFDHHLATALSTARPEFDEKKHVLGFHPNEPVDIPEPLTSTVLYHIMGNHRTYPDFAVWEEDYMEFICGLLQHQVSRDTMPCIFRQLKKRYLLLLGAPFSDWVVRFFLRTARSARLSTRGDDDAGECLTDHPENLEAPLVFFFDKLIQATRVVQGDPAGFVDELSRRWQAAHGEAANDEDFLLRIAEQMPKDAIFISYAQEDKQMAFVIARALHNAGVPVWLDKARLALGQNYESQLQYAVGDCSFFISLVSPTTEADIARKRYFHKERDWAAQRHPHGCVFYLPVVIHAALPHGWKAQYEPPDLADAHLQRRHLPDGKVTATFVREIRGLVETFRASGRPRG